MAGDPWGTTSQGMFPAWGPRHLQTGGSPAPTVKQHSTKDSSERERKTTTTTRGGNLTGEGGARERAGGERHACTHETNFPPITDKEVRVLTGQKAKGIRFEHKSWQPTVLTSHACCCNLCCTVLRLAVRRANNKVQQDLQ